MDNIDTIRAAYASAKKGRTSIVFFRIGTFYIIIFDDAKLVSKIHYCPKKLPHRFS